MGKLEKLLDQAQEHLDEGEEVVATVLGTHIREGGWMRKGILIATDHRLVFFAKKLSGYELAVFPYSQISSIQSSKETGLHQVTFIASGNWVTLKAIANKYDAPAFVRTVQNQLAASNAPQTSQAPTGDGSRDVADQIRKLAALRDDGLLTAAEYESKRVELLARL